MENYELIEHTADVGIRVKAKTLKDLFKNAALSMFDIIAQKQEAKIKKSQKIKIEQKANNLEELFVNWLNELLSLSATEELIFSDFRIAKLNDKNLEATLIGDSMKNYNVNTEIKAATYCDLRLKESKSSWQAQVIFDV